MPCCHFSSFNIPKAANEHCRQRNGLPLVGFCCVRVCYIHFSRYPLLLMRPLDVKLYSTENWIIVDSDTPKNERDLKFAMQSFYTSRQTVNELTHTYTHNFSSQMSIEANETAYETTECNRENTISAMELMRDREKRSHSSSSSNSNNIINTSAQQTVSNTLCPKCEHFPRQ